MSVCSSEKKLVVSSLKVGGFQPFSMVDYPHHLSAIVFCQGCPWRCRYCHNVSLQRFSHPSSETWEEVLQKLSKRQKNLEAIVFSGGEPTLQIKALIQAMRQVKELGLKVGLHTGGYAPLRLQLLLPLLDWVGLDIKTVPEKYRQVTQRKIGGEPAWQSLKVLASSQVPFSCRTTVHPDLHSLEDIEEMALKLQSFGVRCYSLQLFRKEGCEDVALKKNARCFHIPSLLQQRMRSMFAEFEIV